MRNRIMFVSIICVLLLAYGCQKTVTKEEKITEVLEIAYTLNNEDYERLKEEHTKFVEDRTYLYEERAEQVKDYFTESGYLNASRYRTMTGFSRFISNTKCTTRVEDITLDFREQSTLEELVCYYKFNLTVTFENSEIDPFTNPVEGVMTLHKVDEEWKIHVIKVSRGSFYTEFQKHFKTE